MLFQWGQPIETQRLAGMETVDVDQRMEQFVTGHRSAAYLVWQRVISAETVHLSIDRLPFAVLEHVAGEDDLIKFFPFAQHHQFPDRLRRNHVVGIKEIDILASGQP